MPFAIKYNKRIKVQGSLKTLRLKTQARDFQCSSTTARDF